MNDYFDFLPNKYTKWYMSIISKAQGTTITGYFEKHQPESIAKMLATRERKRLLKMRELSCPV
jgi:hypothetical protein